jgi:nucleotide-binding universal stress UspA family protein
MDHTGWPIVVGVDGTEEALSASRWAAAMAARLRVPLHLVHVMRSVDEALLTIASPQDDDAGAYPRQLGQAVLDRVADAVHTELPELHVSKTLSQRNVAEALIELSNRARMVVLACEEVSPAGVVLVGSTTLAVAARSSCPVLAWRGSAAVQNSKPIVVAVDEGRVSRAALTTAFELADGLGVGLTAVNAMSSRRPAGEIDIAVIVDWEALKFQAKLRLSGIVEPIADCWPHVPVTCVVETGSARRVIVDHAAAAQLVVVGSRGRGELASVLLGSTGLSLLHHSPAPVVICPASTADDESAAVQDWLSSSSLGAQ